MRTAEVLRDVRTEGDVGMIVDIVKSDGVPFRCESCKTHFLWKPDRQGKCGIRTKVDKCEKTECEYYLPATKQCPECGSVVLTEVPAIIYKILRDRRGRKVNWDDAYRRDDSRG